MTPHETDQLADTIVAKLADRIDKRIDEKVALHAATCVVGKEFGEQKAEARGRKAVWVLLFTVASGMGGVVVWGLERLL